MDHLTFRAAQDEDLREIVALWRACGLSRSWNDPEKDFSFARNSNNSEVLVGLVGDEIVASALVGHDGHRGAVYYVSVHPDHRRKGFGREIMEAAESWLSARGVWKLNLMVRGDNSSVVDFYNTLGYDREDRIVLSKRLA